ncbi:Hypothetical predicted protein [Octopus vulgaris]|uniref:Uncharacterized protein n=1 Tax=Octopus vulgaris TaxID=6645 RepID=A0AA36FPA7_OCTVU|nr:Hypothetical predicted protein [Octopus vulgaris]
MPQLLQNNNTKSDKQLRRQRQRRCDAMHAGTLLRQAAENSYNKIQNRPSSPFRKAVYYRRNHTDKFTSASSPVINLPILQVSVGKEVISYPTDTDRPTS